MTCFKCHGPYHHATGWLFASGVAYCGRCAREFATFYKSRMAERSSDSLKLGGAFTVAASTSLVDTRLAPT